MQPTPNPAQNPTAKAANNAPAANTVPALDNRREKRLHVAVPIKVFLDPQSTESEACCTFEISMTGARLMPFRGAKEAGQVVWLQRQNRRAKYKIIWIGQPKTSQQGQIGVEILEPANVIWENELKMRIQQSDSAAVL
jgi:hypothetical protein